MVARLLSSSSRIFSLLLHSPVAARECQYLVAERESNVSMQPSSQSPHLSVRGDTLIFRDRQGLRVHNARSVDSRAARKQNGYGTHLADLHSLLTPLFMSVGGPLDFLILLLLLLYGPSSQCFTSLYLLPISWTFHNPRSTQFFRRLLQLHTLVRKPRPDTHSLSILFDSLSFLRPLKSYHHLKILPRYP